MQISNYPQKEDLFCPEIEKGLAGEKDRYPSKEDNNKRRGRDVGLARGRENFYHGSWESRGVKRSGDMETLRKEGTTPNRARGKSGRK